MNVQTSTIDITEQLEQLLASGEIPTKASQQGARLLERMKSPVRVAILGLPGSGKTQLLNLLSGRRVFPEGADLPSLELSWAKAANTFVTFEDQSILTHDGIALEKLNEAGSVFAKLEMDLPFLKNVSLLDLLMNGTLEDQEDVIDWAVEHADIILWCSQKFSTQEHMLWSRVPEVMKDHSFFVLTKADELSSQGVLSARISELQDTVAEEFLSLVPVATLQGVDALGVDGATDEAALIGSGGKALTTAINRQVEMGNRAASDSVLLFLNRYSSEQPLESQSTLSVQVEFSAKSTKQGENVTEAVSNSEPEFNPTPDALNYLRSRATELEGFLPARNPENLSEILEHCAKTTDHLVEIVTAKGTGDVNVVNLQDDMMEAADVVLLMQMEAGEGPAADAVTLLLQLQRELEAKIAA